MNLINNDCKLCEDRQAVKCIWHLEGEWYELAMLKWRYFERYFVETYDVELDEVLRFFLIFSLWTLYIDIDGLLLLL